MIVVFETLMVFYFMFGVSGIGWRTDLNSFFLSFPFITLSKSYVYYANVWTQDAWFRNELINLLFWVINTHMMPVFITSHSLLTALKFIITDLQSLCLNCSLRTLSYYLILFSEPFQNWTATLSSHSFSVFCSVCQVRVCFDLQWPVGTRKSSPERSVSPAARRPNEHLH